MKKIFFAIAIMVSLVAADGFDAYFTKLIKTTKGFNVNKVHTYYESRIIWGEGYCDHADTTAFKHGVVIAYGEGWEYTALTDDLGNFKVEVKPNSTFTIKASDGSYWNTYDGTLEAIATGTTKTDI